MMIKKDRNNLSYVQLDKVSSRAFIMDHKYLWRSQQHPTPPQAKYCLVLAVSLLATLGFLAADKPDAYAQTPTFAPGVMQATGGSMNALLGKTWTLAAWQEETKAVSLNPGTITAEFSADRMSGTGGCNRYQAPYRMSADTIQVAAIISTRMACPDPERSAQESRYFSALQAAQSIKLEANHQLVIQYRLSTGKTGTLAFTSPNTAPNTGSNSKSPTQSLQNSAWTLVNWQYDTANRSIVAGTSVTVEFRNNRISGHGGCNRFSGSYQQQGQSLRVSDFIMTEMACEPATLMAQETEFLQAIVDTQSVQTTPAGQLQIAYRSAQGKIGLLTFAAAPPLAQTPSPESGDAGDAVVQGNADGTTVEQAIPPSTPTSPGSPGASEASPPCNGS
jgi:heat shock protein HslJ